MSKSLKVQNFQHLLTSANEARSTWLPGNKQAYLLEGCYYTNGKYFRKCHVCIISMLTSNKVDSFSQSLILLKKKKTNQKKNKRIFFFTLLLILFQLSSRTAKCLCSILKPQLEINELVLSMISPKSWTLPFPHCLFW